MCFIYLSFGQRWVAWSGRSGLDQPEGRRGNALIPKDVQVRTYPVSGAILDAGSVT